MKKTTFCVLMSALVLAGNSLAAFIVETHSTGRGYSNFSGTGPSYTTTKGTAPGLLATSTAFGGNAVAPNMDTYVFSYTPGTNADNWDVPDYQYFGNGLYTTNLEGGQTGYYNVYITWISSANVDLDGCTLAVTHDGGVVSWDRNPANTAQYVNGNDGGTNWIAELWGPFLPGTVISGANNKWLKIANEVLLTAGQTYTMTQVAKDNAYVSMRSAGVMWEFVRVPEPATLVLLSLGGLLLRKRS